MIEINTTRASTHQHQIESKSLTNRLHLRIYINNAIGNIYCTNELFFFLDVVFLDIHIATTTLLTHQLVQIITCLHQRAQPIPTIIFRIPG